MGLEKESHREVDEQDKVQKPFSAEEKKFYTHEKKDGYEELQQCLTEQVVGHSRSDMCPYHRSQ